jgi:hypothetical protein
MIELITSRTSTCHLLRGGFYGQLYGGSSAGSARSPTDEIARGDRRLRDNFLRERSECVSPNVRQARILTATARTARGLARVGHLRPGGIATND